MTGVMELRAATAADDASLREILRKTPLPGAVELTLEREPSFFGGDLDAAHHDAVVLTRGDQAMACGSRIVKRSWWQGEDRLAAYLGDLRVHPDHQRRAGRVIRDGFRCLLNAATQHPASVTWTAIFEENRTARHMLVGRTAGLPEYIDRGRLLCPILLVSRGSKRPSPDGRVLHAGSIANWEEITHFLTVRQRHRPLAPVHAAEDFAQGSRWRGLCAEDFILARRGQELVGVIAVWDVRTVRQARVKTVHGWLRLARAALRWTGKLSGLPSLPDDGAVLPMGFASFLAVENDDVKLAGVLLRAARSLAALRGIQFLATCLHEDDPLAPALRGLPAIPSHGKIYEVVPYPAQPAWYPGVPCIEAATL